MIQFSLCMLSSNHQRPDTTMIQALEVEWYNLVVLGKITTEHSISNRFPYLNEPLNLSAGNIEPLIFSCLWGGSWSALIGSIVKNFIWDMLGPGSAIHCC